jgi:hypothetical protein
MATLDTRIPQERDNGAAIAAAFIEPSDDHAIDPRILGLETIAQLNDSALAGFAKLYFTVGGPLRASHAQRHVGDHRLL